MDHSTLIRCAAVAALMAAAAPVAAQQQLTANLTSGMIRVGEVVFSPNTRPTLTAGDESANAIKIDGVLDDAAWQTAVIATNFSETFPGDQTEPPIGITVSVTYDEKNLYLGFNIQDDPAQIRASMTDRDNIWQDDYVGIVLDTYSSNAWAYFIAANPFGIQGDTRIVQGGNEDMGFNLVFQSKGQINEDGYSVEMAIPFRSLRFPEAEEQKWNVNFWITHPRASRNTYSWAAKDRDDPCWLCQAGQIDGIKNVSAGNNLELLPTLVGGVSGARLDSDDPNSDFVGEKAKIEPSLGIKYAFNSNVIGDAAINPDFSQIEADAAQIDVNTTFALFFPERRPFFQEGSELYETEIQTVYTRSINNPIAAGKLTGRFGTGNAAYLGAVDADTPIILPFEEQSGFVDAGRSVTNIGRYKKTSDNGSFIGGLLTDRRYEVGGSGTTVGLDGNLRFLHNYMLKTQLVGTFTEEPVAPELTEDLGDLTFGTSDQYTAAFDGESYSGYSTYFAIERDSRFWNFQLEHTSSSPTFRADAGFVSRNSINRIGFWNGFDFRPGSKFVDQLSPSFNVGYEWNFDGVRKDEYAWIGFFGRFTGQTNAGANVLLFSNERFKGIDFRGINRFNVWFDSNFSDPLKVGAEFSAGRAIARGEEVPVLGDGVDVSVWGTIRPSSRFRIRPSFDFSKLNNPESGESIFNGYIGRIRFNYQFTRRLFLRLVTQYNDFSKSLEIDPLLTYSVNPFTEIYLGSTHDLREFEQSEARFTPTSRQFFFKIRYLVRT